MTSFRLILSAYLLFLLSAPCIAQDPAAGVAAKLPANEVPSTSDTESERWNLYYQATSIGDHHGSFTAPYSGPLSLISNPESDVSITTTLFFTARLEQNTFLVFNPEIAGGKGFSGVTGIANQPNGEIPRVASATP
jgi:high affinity Mn2+ porin